MIVFKKLLISYFNWYENFFRSPCGANGLCINEKPGYICDCVQGYEFDGTTCIGNKHASKKWDRFMPNTSCLGDISE